AAYEKGDSSQADQVVAPVAAPRLERELPPPLPPLGRLDQTEHDPSMRRRSGQPVVDGTELACRKRLEAAAAASSSIRAGAHDESCRRGRSVKDEVGPARDGDEVATSVEEPVALPVGLLREQDVRDAERREARAEVALLPRAIQKAGDPALDRIRLVGS